MSAPPPAKQRAAVLDVWLADLFASAAAGPEMALVALGGLGRRECAPNGDLDLVLLHAGGGTGDTPPDLTTVGPVAEQIWYPIWDAGLTLDHSVRTHDEALRVAGEDTKAALGLLDARHIAGDRA